MRHMPRMPARAFVAHASRFTVTWSYGRCKRSPTPRPSCRRRPPCRCRTAARRQAEGSGWAQAAVGTGGEAGAAVSGSGSGCFPCETACVTPYPISIVRVGSTRATIRQTLLCCAGADTDHTHRDTGPNRPPTDPAGLCRHHALHRPHRPHRPAAHRPPPTAHRPPPTAAAGLAPANPNPTPNPNPNPNPKSALLLPWQTGRAARWRSPGRGCWAGRRRRRREGRGRRSPTASSSRRWRW
jgi:hypothetical protein